MKTIRILITVCIALCLASLYSQGQSTSDKATEPMYYGFECDGVFDVLQGEITWHFINHFNPEGMWKWNKWQAHSNGLVSTSTGEQFNLSTFENNMIKSKLEIIQRTTNIRLIGDMGTHLIYSVKWHIDMSTGTWTKVDEKIMCK